MKLSETEQGITVYGDFCAKQYRADERSTQNSRLTSESAFLFHFDQQKEFGGKVVDFGGAVGDKTRLIQNVTVVEVDKSAQAWMSKHGVPFVESLDSFEDGEISAIYCSHTLEHLENPFAYLLAFQRKLKPGGKLIIVSPADGHTLDPIRSKCHSVDHLQTWNFEHLHTALTRSGFTVKACRYHAFPFIFHRFLQFNRSYLRLLNRAERHRSLRLLIYIYNQAWTFLKESVLYVAGFILRRDLVIPSSMGELVVWAEKPGA